MIKPQSSSNNFILQLIEPQLIRMDLQTQTRIEIDQEVVQEYTEAMENGAKFPPIIVFFDTETQDYILADGFHRLLAHLKTKPNDRIQIEQHLGTVKDALWFAAGANKTHGLQRSGEDKRNAIRIALLHPNGFGMSDRRVAAYIGVTGKTVAAIRKTMEEASEIPKPIYRLGIDGRKYRTGVYVRTPENERFCSNCGNYDNSCCMIDGELHLSTNPGCPDFEDEYKEPDRVEGRPVTCKYRRKHPSEVVHRVSRRHKGDYIRVPLDKTNPDRAACEIRMFLGDNYLAALVKAGAEILRED